MATNVKYNTGGAVSLELTVGASKSAGEVLLISEMPVFLLEASDSNNKATCIIPGVSLVVDLAVVGADGSGNSAVALGDKVYLDSTVYNVDDANGVWIGYALEAVSSGATATIKVALVAS